MRKSLPAANGPVAMVLLWDLGNRLNPGSLLHSPLERLPSFAWALTGAEGGE